MILHQNLYDKFDDQNLQLKLSSRYMQLFLNRYYTQLINTDKPQQMETIVVAVTVIKVIALTTVILLLLNCIQKILKKRKPHLVMK